jgi:replicative DNA helicase
MAEDLLDKDQHEAEKDLSAWKELEIELFLAFIEIIKGLFPDIALAGVKQGQGITIEKKKRSQDQNLEIQQPAIPTETEAAPTPGYTKLYGVGVNNLTPENVKAIAAIMRSEMGDTVVGGEGLIVKFNGKTLYETDETGKIITHSRISQQVRDRLEAIQPGAKSTLAQAQPANSGAIDQAMNTIADETAKDIAAKNAAKQKTRLPANTIEEAITFLASQDDGAKSADGKGYNADDSYFGNKLAKDIADGVMIDADRAKFALDLLQKYSRQLAVGGYKLPEWEDVQDKYPSKSMATDLSKEAARDLPAPLISLDAIRDEADDFQDLPSFENKLAEEPLSPLEQPELIAPALEGPELPISAIKDSLTSVSTIPITEANKELPPLVETEHEEPSPVEQPGVVYPDFKGATRIVVEEPELIAEVTTDPELAHEEPSNAQELVTSEPIAEESLKIPAFRQTTSKVKLPEEPAAPSVVEAINVAPIEPESITPEVTPQVAEPISVPKELAPKLSISQKISQKITDAAKDAAKTVTDAVVAKVKSDIESTNNTLVKPMVNVVNNAVVKPVADAVKGAQDLTNSVVKETIDDIKNIGSNSAQNIRDTITFQLPQDSPLIKGYDMLRSTIGKGIIPESNQQIAAAVNKFSDSAKEMIVNIGQAEEETIAQNHQITLENKVAWQATIVDTKKVVVAFQLFSANTDEKSLSDVKFPDGSRLSATISDDRVSTLSYTDKDSQTTELGAYDQKNKSYTATDVNKVSNDLQNIAQYIEPGSWKVKDFAKEINQLTVSEPTQRPVAAKVPEPAPVKALTERPVPRKPIEIDDRSLLNPELEEQLIAKVLTEPDAFKQAVEQGISANSFDFEPYRETFKAAEKLSASNQQVNLNTIDTELGGKFSEQSVDAINRMDLSVSLDYVLGAVETKELRSNALRAASEIRKIAYEDAPLKDAADKSVQTINLIKDKNLPEPTISPQRELVSAVSEQKVLSALVSQPKFYAEAKQFGLKAESFSSPENQRIFDAIGGIHDQGEEINSLSVRGRLSTEDKTYASNVVANFPMSPSVVNDLKNVVELTGKRELIRISDKMTNLAYDTTLGKQDLSDNFDQIKGEVAAVVPAKNISASTTKANEKAEQLAKSDTGTPKMPKVVKAKSTAVSSKAKVESVATEPTPTKTQKAKGGR